MIEFILFFITFFLFYKLWLIIGSNDKKSKLKVITIKGEGVPSAVKDPVIQKIDNNHLENCLYKVIESMWESFSSNSELLHTNIANNVLINFYKKIELYEKDCIKLKKIENSEITITRKHGDLHVSFAVINQLSDHSKEYPQLHKWAFVFDKEIFSISDIKNHDIYNPKMWKVIYTNAF